MKVADDFTSEEGDSLAKEDPKVKQFSVSNPIKVAGHVKYRVTGLDSEGTFEETRRFREFWALREALAGRWPGIYMPCYIENTCQPFLRRNLLATKKKVS